MLVNKLAGVTMAPPPFAAVENPPVLGVGGLATDGTGDEAGIGEVDGVESTGLHPPTSAAVSTTLDETIPTRRIVASAPVKVARTGGIKAARTRDQR